MDLGRWLAVACPTAGRLWKQFIVGVAKGDVLFVAHSSKQASPVLSLTLVSTPALPTTRPGCCEKEKVRASVPAQTGSSVGTGGCAVETGEWALCGCGRVQELGGVSTPVGGSEHASAGYRPGQGRRAPNHASAVGFAMITGSGRHAGRGFYRYYSHLAVAWGQVGGQKSTQETRTIVHLQSRQVGGARNATRGALPPSLPARHASSTKTRHLPTALFPDAPLCATR